MSAIIDEKIVAGAKDPSEIKEDPIVALTVYLLLHYANFFSLK